MQEAIATVSPEPQVEDLFHVRSLEVKCASCGEYCVLGEKSVPSKHATAYTFRCPLSRCGGAVTLRVPRSEEAERGVPPQAQAKETELEPDDSFTIAQLDVLCQDGLCQDGLSPDGLSPDGLSPDGAASCLRQDKWPDGERTAYAFRCPDTRCGKGFHVFVPRP